MKKNTLAITMALLFFSFSDNVFAGAASPKLISAAKAEIARGSDDTACSAYIRRVLNRAGYPVQGFMANDFGAQARRYLSSWSIKAFHAGSEASGRNALKRFLNAAPDKTAFLLQWIRSSGSGHVAMVVKEAANLFRIYQAQQGLHTPYSKITSVDGLLYSRNEYGDRSNMRVYFQ